MAGARTGELVVFEAREALTGGERRRFFRGLWGYEDRSQFGRYRYERPGLLSDIPHVRLTRGVIVVAQEHATEVLQFLRKGARVQTRMVHLTEGDKRALSRTRERTKRQQSPKTGRR